MSDWTTPKTWNIGELVTAADLNAQLRDNLSALKNPPSAHYTLNETANYQTTSTVFVDVDSTKLKFTLNTNGGDVMVHFHGVLNGPYGSTLGYLDVAVDGVRVGGADGIIGKVIFGGETFAFTVLVRGLSAGEHTFALQWKVNQDYALLYAGAGTASYDMRPQFWAREVS